MLVKEFLKELLGDASNAQIWSLGNQILLYAKAVLR